MKKKPSKEEKYAVIVNRKQLQLISECIEDCSRFASGQPELQNTIASMLSGKDDSCEMRDGAESCLQEAKRLLLPGMAPNAYKGYNATPFIGNTYQIHRSISHFLALMEEWNNVYSGATLPSGDLGGVVIEKVKE